MEYESTYLLLLQNAIGNINVTNGFYCYVDSRFIKTTF